MPDQLIPHSKKARLDEVLAQLKKGIRKFQAEIYPAHSEQYRRVMNQPQGPHTLLITCADSRIQPDLLTHAAPGEIFVARNIGNMVPAHGETPGEVGAVIEFAVTALGVRHIVICGHTGCGAMKALLAPESANSLPAVQAWLTNAHAALAAARAIAQSDQDLMRVVTEQNVLLQMNHLRTHPAVAGALARGDLHLSGWIYDIAAGQVRICEGNESSFDLV